MTDSPTPVPDPGPRELPGLDSWWDGAQWRRIGESVATPSYGQAATPSYGQAATPSYGQAATPSYGQAAEGAWGTPPAQGFEYGRPMDNRGDITPYGAPASFPRPALAHVPEVYPTPPRRSRINGGLWSAVTVGAVFLVGSLANSMAQGATASPQRAFVDIPVVEPAGAAGALPLEAAEEFAAGYETHRDAQGSYVASAQDVTRAFGAEIVWAEFGTPDPTTKCVSGDDSPQSVLAWFCGAEPYLIRINRIAYDMPGIIYTPVFVDAVKHELAHLIIQQRCGKSKPSAGTVELEGVTNSYAVLYLGADRKELAALSSTFPEYALSTRTDEVATWIHAGVCWFESSGISQ